ncbi:MAG: RND family transporter [Chlorobi bacterium]|nr:RND family transporter [Chlorobiota bacterium]
MEWLSKNILKLRWPVIIIVTGLTLFFGYRAGKLTINSDLISSLPDDDPVAEMYKNIGKEFGGNDMGMVALETKNVFTTEVLQHVKQITDTLLVTPGILTVTSMTNIIDIRSEEWGIEISKLIDEYDLPDTPEELRKLRERVYSKEMYKGAIVSDDGTTTLIIYTTLDDADKQQTVITVKKKVKAMNLPEKLYFAGLPMMMNDVTGLIVSDLSKLIPLAFIVIAIVLFFSFRSVKGVVLPLLTASIAVIWTMGLMQVTGYEITMISNNIPIILFAVGSAYAIHVINRVNMCTEKDEKQKLVKALAYIIVPVFLAAATTMTGFISFVFGAYLKMIKDFGIFTAVGTFFSLLLSVTFVPALIRTFSLKKSSVTPVKDSMKNFITRNILKPVLIILNKHPRNILVVWISLIVLATGGFFLIKRSVNMQNYFRKDNPTRVAEDVMQRKFGGSQPVFVVFEGDMQSPYVLDLMNRTEQYMKKFPEISYTQSIADLIKQMNDVMGEGEKIPESKAKIQDLWFLLDGQDIMPQLVSDDLKKGIIQSRFKSYDSKKMKDFVSYMNKFISSNSNDKCKISLTGLPSVYVRMDRSLFNSQMSSLAIALVVVLIIVGLILHSFRLGVFATIPIISTISILFGFMGYAGIPLDVATVLVASVALGIGIDYSIHVITHFNHIHHNTGNISRAIEETILTSGKAIFINVLSVAAGFLVLLFSQMAPLQNFGLLVAISMIGSGLGALTLLPVVLLLQKQSLKPENKNSF